MPLAQLRCRDVNATDIDIYTILYTVQVTHLYTDARDIVYEIN